MAEAITVSEARKKLFPLLERVVSDHDAVEIVSKHGNAVLLSKADYDSMMETAYLLNPANAPHLLESIREADEGKARRRELVEPPE